jgi:hypothetical protein
VRLAFACGCGARLEIRAAAGNVDHKLIAGWLNSHRGCHGTGGTWTTSEDSDGG